MSLKTKLFILSILILSVLITALSLQGVFESRRLSLILGAESKEYNASVESILKLKSSSLVGYTYDYTYWDEMVDFIKNKNEDWAKNILDASISTYAANVDWVYSADLDLIYSVDNLDAEDELREIPLDKPVIKELFSKAISVIFSL